MQKDELLAIFGALDNTPVERKDVIRCPFPYIGSKDRAIAQHGLLEHLPYSDVWVDAFGGSGNVTLARQPSKLEVFNDRHAGITSFYRCLQNPNTLQQLIERLDMTIHSREEFVWCKETWQHDVLDDLERAARWYYLITYSFIGKGVAFGRTLKAGAAFAGKVRDKLSLFEPIHRRFRSVQVENQDWRQILRDYDSPDTVFYLDPPYYGISCYEHNMTPAEHLELCQRIFDLRGYVALSGYNNPLYDKFPWDDRKTWFQRVSATTKAITTDTSNVTDIGISQSEEVLWIKYSY